MYFLGEAISIVTEALYFIAEVINVAHDHTLHMSKASHLIPLFPSLHFA